MEWSQKESGYSNPWFTETFYFRFCQACNFDFAKTKVMLKNFFDFRVQNNIDNILQVSFVKDSHFYSNLTYRDNFTIM